VNLKLPAISYILLEIPKCGTGRMFMEDQRYVFLISACLNHKELTHLNLKHLLAVKNQYYATNVLIN
jgi:hypothetical protein